MSETTERKIHKGRNVKRFREMLGLKQEGWPMSWAKNGDQKKVSLLNITPLLVCRLALRTAYQQLKMKND